jgi:hypothetical protein
MLVAGSAQMLGVSAWQCSATNQAKPVDSTGIGLLMAAIQWNGNYLMCQKKLWIFP